MSQDLSVGLPTLVMKTGTPGLVNASGLSAWSSTSRQGLGLAATAPGWISGNLANAAVSATVTSIFDLGDDWQQYGLIQIAIKATQALASINCYGSDDGTTSEIALAGGNTDGSLLLELTAAGSVQGSTRANGRYIRVVIVNGSVAQGSGSFVRTTAYTSA